LVGLIVAIFANLLQTSKSDDTKKRHHPNLQERKKKGCIADFVELALETTSFSSLYLFLFSIQKKNRATPNAHTIIKQARTTRTRYLTKQVKLLSKEKKP